MSATKIIEGFRELTATIQTKKTTSPIRKPTMTTKGTGKSRWWQFSLRSMFWLVTLSAVVCWFRPWTIRTWRGGGRFESVQGVSIKPLWGWSGIDICRVTTRQDGKTNMIVYFLDEGYVSWEHTKVETMKNDPAANSSY